MKKMFLFLLILFSSVASAEKTDGDGRKWITATDLNHSEMSKSELDEALKNYVILDNDIHKCFFPEIWAQPENQIDFLDKWAEDEKGRFSLYTRIFYRLPYAKLPQEIIDKMDNTSLRDEVSTPPLSDFYEQYQKTTSIKTNDDCERISEFITDDLLKNY